MRVCHEVIAMLHRRLIASGALVVLCAACGPGPQEEARAPEPAVASSVVVATTAPTTTALPATTLPVTTFPATSTAPPAAPELPGYAVLVVNEAGVHRVDSSGRTTTVVAGAVATAVDDGRGGLLYQECAGRYRPDNDPASTTVWWMPAGSATRQALLVPTPESHHALTLHAAYPTGDGLVVVYTRHAGSIPFDDMEDTLRTYDTASKRIIDLFTVRGWEWALDQVSVGGGNIAATEHQMFGSWCVFTDASGEVLSLPGVPVSAPVCAEDIATDVWCPTSCALSLDGSLIAFKEETHSGIPGPTTLVVRDLTTGNELGRWIVPDETGWRLGDLAIQDGRLLVNRNSDDGTYGQALVFDVGRPSESPEELPLAGMAHFAAEPIQADQG